MSHSSVLRYKVATKKLLSSFSLFFNEIQGKYSYFGKKYYCPVCGSGLSYFNNIDFSYLKHLEDNAFMFPMFMLETSNLYNNYCPHCRANDRDRLYAIYIANKLKELKGDQQVNLVDFAPQTSLSAFLKSQQQIIYRSADLYSPLVDDKVDLTDMKIYNDNRFDIFICSHILEHIKDDKKAMRELYRILKPGGWGIAMVPIMLSLEETYEKNEPLSEDDRWKHYMQNDHERLYSKKGFISNLEMAGFKVNQFGINYFGEETFNKAGIQNRSVLYIVEKK